MDKIFLDTDVILDFLLAREPFAKDAARIISLSERRKIQACTTVLVFANAYYILRKLAPHKKVVEKLLQLSRLIEIIDLTKPAVILALHSDFSDFEDGLQCYAAIAGKVKIVITSNVRDYKHSELAVLSPDMYLLNL
jgi:predicted nucleic acid-binding protein